MILAIFALLQVAGSAPAKMIVMRGDTGVAVTDYPSLARCEAARARLARMEEAHAAANPPKRQAGGGVIITPWFDLTTTCLPG